MRTIKDANDAKDNRDGQAMIEKLVNEIAAEMLIPLSAIQLIDGCRLGIKGSCLLKIIVNDTVASTLLHQAKMSDSDVGTYCERTRHEIRNAMCRLQILLEK